MMKKILLVCLSIIIVLSLGAVAFAKEKNENENIGDVITQKETALKIGRALLEEHFPDTFINDEIPIEAEEKKGIWKVHNVINNRISKTKDGNVTVIKGGELYVKFRKDTGEVVRIGVDD